MKITRTLKTRIMTDYKTYKKNYNNRSEGFGDTVERITKATGIKKAVDYVSDKLDKDCGCNERKRTLNRKFPYYRPELFTKKEYEYLNLYFKPRGEHIPTDQWARMIEISNRVFRENKDLKGCGGCTMNKVVQKLKKLYDEYR